MNIDAVAVNALAARIEVLVTPDAPWPYVELQRSADGGRTWLVVRGENPNDWTTTYCAAQRTLYDTEAPLDVPVRYRARGWSGADATDFTLITRSYTLTSTTDRWLLAPVRDATDRIASYTRSAQTDQRDISQGIFYALGRRDPVVTSDVRRTRTGTFTFLANSLVEHDAFTRLADAVDVICVRAPGSHWWGMRYVVLGVASWERPTDRPDDAWDVVLAWTEVANPPLPATPIGATYGDVADRIAQYSGLPPRFATYAELASWAP